MTSYVEEAPMGVQITWDTVDWQYVSRHVNRLQVRIAKAVKAEGRRQRSAGRLA